VNVGVSIHAILYETGAQSDHRPARGAARGYVNKKKLAFGSISGHLRKLDVCLTKL